MRENFAAIQGSLEEKQPVFLLRKDLLRSIGNKVKPYF